MPTGRRRTSRAIRGLAVLAAAALLAPAIATAAEPSDLSGATALVQATVDEVLVILKDESLDTAGRRRRIERLALERFDFATMSQLVVARYWRQFSVGEKQAFVREFKAFLARTYGERIDLYSDEDVEVVGRTPAPRGDAKVTTRVVGGHYDGAKVEYRLRAKDGGWRVIDVKVEGISLVLNYRDQFKAVLSRGGPQDLIEQLKKKNAEAG